MRRRHLLAFPLAAAAPLAARERPLIVASFSILGDLVRQIVGDQAELRVIVGPSVDAHDFQPRPSDAASLRSAAVLVRNGLGFDGWFDRLARAAGSTGRDVLASENIVPLRSGDARAAVDPHAWQDVRLTQRYVRTIARHLVAASPDDAPLWTARAEAFVDRLGTLDTWVRAAIAAVPEARRQVITSHGAFGYFASAYGVRFSAPQGLGGGQPSAAAVARLVQRIRAGEISAVFMEGGASNATLDRLAKEAGVRVRGRLYADALSAPDGPAPTYEAMVRHNVGLLVPAMRGEA